MGNQAEQDGGRRVKRSVMLARVQAEKSARQTLDDADGADAMPPFVSGIRSGPYGLPDGPSRWSLGVSQIVPIAAIPATCAWRCKVSRRPHQGRDACGRRSRPARGLSLLTQGVEKLPRSRYNGEGLPGLRDRPKRHRQPCLNAATKQSSARPDPTSRPKQCRSRPHPLSEN